MSAPIRLRSIRCFNADRRLEADETSLASVKGGIVTAKANEPVASHNVPLGRDGSIAITTPNGGHVIRRLFAKKGSRVRLRAIARWLGENHDHFLSAAEFQDAVAGSAKTVFAMFDANKDGQLTEAEASAAMSAAGLRLGMPKLAQKD